MNKRAITLLAISPLAALVLSGCGSTGSSGSNGHNMTGMGGATSSMPVGGDHNAADVRFAQDMIPHHAQAVAMAKLASTNASDPKVKDLARRIQSAQSPEIALMTGWLTAWGEEVPGDMSGHDMSMPGMMSMDDMAALMSATGSGFDSMFLTMMIAHHEGAISQSTTALTSGSDPAVRELAQKIIAAQTTEIAEMKVLLGTG